MRRATRTAGAAGEEAPRETMVTVNWMLDEPTDIETALALDILEHILVGTAAAPLRKALIDSGLGEALAGGGLDDEPAPADVLDRPQGHRRRRCRQGRAR